MEMQASYLRWNTATAALPWGVQHALHDVLNLVSEEKVKIVWGADYSKDHPCLINSIAQMLTVGGGNGIPMMHFAPLVGEFDRINRYLSDKGVNTDSYVSPLAAEVLLRYFSPLKEQPCFKNEADNKKDADEQKAQMEHFSSNFPMDEELNNLAQQYLNSLEVDCFVNDVEGSASTAS